MTPVHLHLLVNHLPIVGTMLGVPLLLVALWRRAELGVAVAAALVLGLSGAGAIVAEESGEEAEHVAERLPDVHEAELNKALDALALDGAVAVYVEILRKPGIRQSKPPAPADEPSITWVP
jgi:hypothetical protein